MIRPALLDRLIEIAFRCPSANIEVVGHTDAEGEEAANQVLSQKRAQAVVAYLVKAGLPADRFTAVGYGSTQPVASNDTGDGRAQNRRIDFVVRWAMIYLITFHWGWLSGSLLLGLAMGWIAVVHRGPTVSRSLMLWLAALSVAWLPPRSRGCSGDCRATGSTSGSCCLCSYLAGCAVGSWLRAWVLSRSMPAKPVI